MGKPKRSGSSSGLRKNHGPKRHMFKDLKPLAWAYHDGLLNKYNCEESFVLACQARGFTKVTHGDWLKYSILKTNKEKDEYLASLKK